MKESESSENPESPESPESSYRDKEDLLEIYLRVAEKLKPLFEDAPTSLGYNDFALIFASLEERLFEKSLSEECEPVKPEHLIKYFKENPATPKDFRLGINEGIVGKYLEKLKQLEIIEGNPEEGYIMYEEFSVELALRKKLRTQGLDDFLFDAVSWFEV